MATLRFPGPYRTVLAASLVGLVSIFPSHVTGQSTAPAVGAGVNFQGFSFGDGMGTDAANLTMIPLAFTIPAGDRFEVEFFGAYASGSVEKGGMDFGLRGLVDTRVRARFQVSPWAVVTALVNLPTGNATHDPEEAVVASVLSTDILGFQEANWGTGAAVTAGVAAAHQAGAWGLGIGASYRLSNGFAPTEGNSLTFEPGDEIRLRAGVDRNVGEDGKFTAGITFQNFSEDLYDEANLFQAGNRLRVDASYAFRTGRSTWAVYGVNAWRESGDIFLDLVNPQDVVVGDTTVSTGSQNLLILGVNGSTPVGSTLRIRPSLDLRIQGREKEPGRGWVVGAGGDMPLRLVSSMDLFPRVRFLLGSLKSATGESVGLWGLELGATVRWGG